MKCESVVGEERGEVKSESPVVVRRIGIKFSVVVVVVVVRDIDIDINHVIDQFNSYPLPK